MLGGVALVIVIITLVVAGVQMATAPTFEAESGVVTDGVHLTFPIECHGIGSGELDSPVFIRRDYVYEGMTKEDLYKYAEVEGLKVRGDMTMPEVEELEKFFATVQENSTFYCAQLRSNQQTGLIATYGTSLLLLMGVAIIAGLTRPRTKPSA